MAVDKLKEIAQYKAKIANLEQQVAKEQNKKLIGLYKEVGFSSTEELIAALKGLSPKTKRGPAKKLAAGKRSKRSKITPAMRAEIVAALKGGAKGTAVAKQYGISIPSIQNIKKENGLTKVTAATKSAKKKALKKTSKKAAKKK